jgi:hypothetical protein
MSDILLVIAAVIVIGLAAVLVIAAMKPDTVRIERSAVIQASPEAIFALINDF